MGRNPTGVSHNYIHPTRPPKFLQSANELCTRVWAKSFPDSKEYGEVKG